MLPLLLALTAHAAPVTPFFGVEWRPLSRQDLVWVEEGRTSGTAVGEFDGAVRPVFSAYGGLWINRYVGLQLGLGMARSTTTTVVEETWQSRHWGVFRPSLDVRLGWMAQRVQRPVPWFLLGVYGDVPSARDVSNGYTPEEQEAADASAASDRARLGAVGGRAGVGVDYRVLPGLSLGLVASVGLHRATYQGGDATFTTIWASTEAALLLTFEWPPAVQRNEARARRRDRVGAGAGAVAPAIAAPPGTPGS